MDTIIKELPIPKEVIEVQEALVPPEPQGIGVGTGIGIAAIVLILAAALAKSKCCKKK